MRRVVLVGWVVALGCSATVEGVDVRRDASAGDGSVPIDVTETGDGQSGGVDGGTVAAVTVDEAIAQVRAALCEQESRCDDERGFPLLGAPREVVELCARTGLGLTSFLLPRSNTLAVEAARAGRARVDPAALARCLSVIRAGCDEDGTQSAACAVDRYVVGDLPRGASCSASAECAEGLWCELPMVDAGLPRPVPRPACLGVCAPRVGERGACVDTEQCPLPASGRRMCDDGRCTPQIELHGFRAEGASCLYRDPYSDAQWLACASGLFCRGEGGSAYCRAPLSLAEGEVCDGEFYRCGDGLRCAVEEGRSEGVCRPGVEPPPPSRGPFAGWGEPCGGACVAYTMCSGDPSQPEAPSRCRVLAPSAVGAPCGVDDRWVRRCDNDSRCVSGVCVRRAELVTVGEGDACGEGRRCAEGFYCSVVTGCTRQRQVGAMCFGSEQCADGQCVDGQCVPRFCPR